MNRKTAERTIALVYSDCKEKVEKVLKDVLKVDTCLEFEIKETRSGFYIMGRDALSDVYEQMTATPLLRQLFRMAWLRIQVWDAKEEVVFGISLDYHHNYGGGSNGHDIMAIGVRKDDGCVRVKMQ